MKAIAEYFRDLAADDRYFGAEPPVPDAEMLARIAEKEVQRRVSAQVTAGSVHLRTTPPADAAPLMAPVSQPAPNQAEPVLDPESKADLAPPAIPEPVDPTESPAVEAASGVLAMTDADDSTLGIVDAAIAKGPSADLPEDTVQAADDALVATAPDTDIETLILTDHAEEYEQTFAMADGPSPETAVAVPADDATGQTDELTALGADVAQDDTPAPLLDDARAPLLATGSEANALEDDTALPSETEETIEAPEFYGQVDVVAEDDDVVAEDIDSLSADLTPDATNTDSVGPVAPQDMVEHAVSQLLQDEDLATADQIESVAEEKPQADDFTASESFPDTPISKARPENVATKLARIRAAVARSVQPVRDDYEDESEVEDAADISPQNFDDTTKAADVPHPVAASVEPADLAQTETPEPPLPNTDVQAPTQAPTVAAEPTPIREQLRARVIKVKKSAIGAALRGLSGTGLVPSADKPVPEPLAPAAAAPVPTPQDPLPVDEGVLSAEAEADLMRELAEVEAELMDEETERFDLDEDDDALGRALSETSPQNVSPTQTVQPYLQDEELLAALGHLDLEFPPLSPPSATVSQATPTTEPSQTDGDLDQVVAQLAKTEAAAERRSAALRTNEQEEDRVNRLLDQTNSALERQENRRRRSAIEHLKAAVLATKAEEADGPQEREDPLQPYRKDLAEVVRPSTAALRDAPSLRDVAPETPSDLSERDPAPKAPVRPARPVASARQTDRPASPDRASSPLVLVSEQRVDANRKDDPVLPRRVTKGHLSEDVDKDTSMVQTDEEAADIFAASTTFAEFTENMGASGLTELLECAAAYASYIEGRPHFSHPQILRHVRQMDGQAELSREDSLRTFGQLLRQGKIRKVKRGQFTISKNSRYIQEARSASV